MTTTERLSRRDTETAIPGPQRPRRATQGLRLALDVRIQPVPLHRARVVVHGNRSFAYNVKADVQFRSELQMAWRAKGMLPKLPLEGELVVGIAFAGNDRPPGSIRRHSRPDVTNVAKAIEDAANGLVWRDDSQIRDLCVRCEAWGDGVEPFVRLEVAPW